MSQLVVVERHTTMKMNVKVKFLIDNPKRKHIGQLQVYIDKTRQNSNETHGLKYTDQTR